jgi:hypothetical protein
VVNPLSSKLPIVGQSDLISWTLSDLDKFVMEDSTVPIEYEWRLSNLSRFFWLLRFDRRYRSDERCIWQLGHDRLK